MRGERAVDAKNGDLDFFAGLRVASEQDSIRRIPARDHRAALLSEDVAEYAVNPNLRVIVHDYLKSDNRAPRLEICNGLSATPINRRPNAFTSSTLDPCL